MKKKANKKAAKKTEKNEYRYAFICDRKKATRFIAVAKLNNTTAAHLINQFMDDYLKKQKHKVV